ncbi:pyruvate kinase, partial [Flavobacteriales bacterium]|nr:pyruvate kinase [Flavobacteriales bacterium]
ACADKKTLINMIKNGVNVCRLNFSHADHKIHLETIRLIKEINQELGVHTAILADLQGPKIRIGTIEEGTELQPGSEFTITSNEILGNSKTAYINYEKFSQDVKEGEMVLINDGKIQIQVLETNKKDTVKTKVIHGGPLSSNKGVNLPNTTLSQPCLTDKDLNDLKFILAQPVEWVGLSFVRSAQDILELKKHISKANHNSRVVAKIEKPEAIENLESIIEVADAVMIARGDLGVEIPMQKVPVIQKKIARSCLQKAKPVIVATQMLESMTENITPTRAEVNDVANSVMDGADAVMLSGETSVGAFPIQAVETMSKIISNVEQEFSSIRSYEIKAKHGQRFISDAICYHSCALAEQAGAKAIITMTHSGYNAIEISSHRPPCKIYAFTNNHAILNTLSLVWGVTGFYYDNETGTDETVADTKQILKDKGFLKTNDLVVNVASMPIKEKGMTNMMRLSYLK